jgi:hypothetical protein
MLWTVANVLMFVMFAFSVVVQVNDPDPMLWMAIYGAAAVACFFEIRRRTPWMFALAVGVAAFMWSGTIAPRVLGRVPFMSMFQAFEMKDIGVEESREMYGLLLIAVWMLAIGFVARQRRVVR